MSTAEMKQILHEYIENAGDEDIEDIYAVVEDKTKPYDKWEDEEFVTEMERRVKDYDEGKTKAYTLEESVERARQAIKNINRK